MEIIGSDMRKLNFKERHMGNLFCKLGWHRPLSHRVFSFIDVVSGRTVYNAECSCGLKWSVDSTSGFRGHKVRHRKQDTKGKECSFCGKHSGKLICLDNEVISDLFVCEKCLKKVKRTAKEVREKYPIGTTVNHLS